MYACIHTYLGAQCLDFKLREGCVLQIWENFPRKPLLTLLCVPIMITELQPNLPITILLVSSPFVWLLGKGPFNEIVLSVWQCAHRSYNNEWDSHGPCFSEALGIVRARNAKQGLGMNIYLLTPVNRCSKEIHRG